MLAEMQKEESTEENDKPETQVVQWTFKKSSVDIIKGYVKKETSFTKESAWAQHILMQEIERQRGTK